MGSWFYTLGLPFPAFGKFIESRCVCLLFLQHFGTTLLETNLELKDHNFQDENHACMHGRFFHFQLSLPEGSGTVANWQEVTKVSKQDTFNTTLSDSESQ